MIFDNGFNQKSFSNYCDFSVTLLHPKLDFYRKWGASRTYIGVINSYKKSKGRFIAFFIAERKDQEEMESIIGSWNVSYDNIIMGDGSSSAQFVSNKFSLYGTKCVGGFIGTNCYKRKVPHVILVKPK